MRASSPPMFCRLQAARQSTEPNGRLYRAILTGRSRPCRGI
jgi:hypothetical protein